MIADDGSAADVRLHGPAGTPLARYSAPLEELGVSLRKSGVAHGVLGRAIGTDLRSGCRIEMAGRPGGRGALVLSVVSGPNAGSTFELTPGTRVIGRADDCDVVLDDPEVSRHHAALLVEPTGAVQVHDLDSTNGTAVEGRAQRTGDRPVPRGAYLALGDTVLTITDRRPTPALVRPTVDGRLLLSRPPRHRVATAALVRVPEPTDSSFARPIPWVAALAPALAGAGIAAALHSRQLLYFALVSPLVTIAGALAERVVGKRARRRTRRTERAARQQAVDRLDATLREEATVRRAELPDPATLAEAARLPAVHIWRRGLADDDVLLIRAGLGEQPSRTTVQRGNDPPDQAGRVPLVPVRIDLRSGPVGIAAPRAVALGVGRWLVMQVAALHPPGAVEIVPLIRPDRAGDWHWLRWLPHLRDAPPLTEEQLVGRVRRLNAEVTLDRNGHASAGTRRRWRLLVVDPADDLAAVPGLGTLLEHSADVAVSAVCVVERTTHVPSGCRSTVTADGPSSSHGRVVSLASGGVDEVIFDQVSEGWADEVARSLSPLCDGDDSNEGLPMSCRLLDLEPGSAEAENVATRWADDDGHASSVIGIAATHAVRVDLCCDGPHALVAGTTGSGKSELLQSWVVGLALRHPPEAISFVLVDYKGGAAFGRCAELPHVAGLVTDLDNHITKRALQSLDCELGRREALFARAGVSDLASYRRAPGCEPLPRLVLVIDEFATLVQELPDFVTGIVDVARRGRSLGIHLVLATQRPAGAVSADIRANCTLRIALRTSQVAESIDVLGSPVAAELDRAVPGRAVMSNGNEMTVFQVGSVSTAAHHEPATPASDDHDSAIRAEILGPWRTPSESTREEDVASDLDRLVGAVADAAASTGRVRAASPWLPALPTDLTAGQLPVPRNADTVSMGLFDLPARRLQQAASVDLSAGSVIVITGAARSGRTTALLTTALAASARLSSNDLALYAIDSADGGLAPLATLPHCATICRIGDGIVAALIARLAAATAERRQVLDDLGFDTARAARNNGAAYPLALIVIDGWEALVQASETEDAGRTVESLLALLREGSRTGISAVIAGDRSTFTPRLSAVATERYVLRLGDSQDYLLAGVPPLPASATPGRGVRVSDGALIQLARPDGATDRASIARTAETLRAADEAHLARTAEACESVRATAPVRAADNAGTAEHARAEARRRSGRPLIEPVRLRPLPDRITVSDLPPTPDAVTLGTGGDRAEPIRLRLFAGGGRLLVAGPPRSGKTTTLTTILLQCAGKRTIVAAPPRSPLRAFADAVGADAIGPLDESDLLRDEPAPDLLLVDDSEAFADTRVGERLAELIRCSGPSTVAVVAGGSDELAVAFRGPAAEARRGRCGILLRPRPADGELLGIRLPTRHASAPPGRGVLVTEPEMCLSADGHPIDVQVALPSPRVQPMWG